MVNNVSLVLGGAQLGLAYGIASSSSFDRDQRVALVSKAVAAGVDHVDTARAYGCSEEVIGTALTMLPDGSLNIITKLAPLAELSPESTLEQVAQAVDASLAASRTALGLERLETFMLHRASHLQDWEGLILQLLRTEREAGRIGQLGVSVQSPAELAVVLEIDCIEHIQIPCNVLDTRWSALLAPLRFARQSRGVSVHLRSVFLQGLLLSRQPSHWHRAGVTDPKEIIAWLDEAVTVTNSYSTADMAVRWALGLDWIDGIVMGVENIDQLSANISYMNNPPLNNAAYDWVSETCPTMLPAVFDPSTWQTT